VLYFKMVCTLAFEVTLMFILQLLMYQSPKPLLLSFDRYSTRHRRVHFVHYCRVLREELDAINSENINNSQFV
jgi:hypothetical protein